MNHSRKRLSTHLLVVFSAGAALFPLDSGVAQSEGHKPSPAVVNAVDGWEKARGVTLPAQSREAVYQRYEADARQVSQIRGVPLTSVDAAAKPAISSFLDQQSRSKLFAPSLSYNLQTAMFGDTILGRPTVRTLIAVAINYTRPADVVRIDTEERTATKQLMLTVGKHTFVGYYQSAQVCTKTFDVSPVFGTSINC